MKPVEFNRFWLQRIATITVICGVAVAGLYGAHLLLPKAPIPDVSLYAAITGAVAVLLGLYTLFGTHPEDISDHARLCYLALLALCTVVLGSTGNVASPFAAIWGAVAIAAPFFGLWGILPALAVAIVGPLFLQWTGTLSLNEALLAIAIAAPFPLLGLLLRPARFAATGETTEDRSYHALATQLSQVAGKSEVVINAIGEGVLAVDGQGTIELINPSAQQIVGWGKEDTIGLNYKSILKLIDSRNNELDSAHDPVAQTFATNAATGPADFSLVTQSGKNILVSVLVSPVGQPGSGAIIVFRDVTREKAEGRQQAEFISTASHEMRTPVAEIEGYLGLVLNPQTAQIDDKARDFVTKAHAAAQHLGRLFQDLLDVSKAEDGRMQSNPKVVDVTKFMSDVVESLRPKADAKSLQLVFKPGAQSATTHEKGTGKTVLPALYTTVDNDHLREVADNLVENAIKYTPSGQVSVDVTGDNLHVTIAITDTGLGIPREDLPHLFQKFYRVDNTETREIGGTGLGLYLCRRLVESMNGRLWVESTYKSGSTFYVELPRTSGVDANNLIQKTEQEPAEPTPTTLPSDQLLDLVVQDESAPQPVAPAPAPVPVPAPTPVTVTPQPAVPPAQPAVPPAQPVAVAPPPAASAPTYEPVLTEMPAAPATQPTAIPHPIEDFPNVQLSTIERDPTRYIAQTEGRAINIPVRDQ